MSRFTFQRCHDVIFFTLHADIVQRSKTKDPKVFEGLIKSCIIFNKLGNFGWLYWAGVLVFIGMLVYQHSIVKPNDLRRVNIAFMTANGIASVVFAAFVIGDLFIN